MRQADYIAAAIVLSISSLPRTGNETIRTASRFSSLIGEASSDANFQHWVNESEIDEGIQNLREVLDIEVISTPHAEVRFIFSRAKIDDLLKGDRQLNDPIVEVIKLNTKLGWGWHLEFIYNSRDQAEGRLNNQSGSDWEPLTIDRPDDELEATITAIAALTNQVRSDNGYAATVPAERDEVLSRVAAGLTYLREVPLITSTAIEAYIIWPLQRLLARFDAKTIIGTSATLARGIFVAWLTARGVKSLDDMFK